MSILDQLKSRAEELAQQRVAADEARREARQPRRPAWVPADHDGKTPLVSLDAEYAGTIDPADVPRDHVEHRQLTEDEQRKPIKGEMSAAQREGLRVQLEMLARENVRRELREVAR